MQLHKYRKYKDLQEIEKGLQRYASLSSGRYSPNKTPQNKALDAIDGGKSVGVTHGYRMNGVS